MDAPSYDKIYKVKNPAGGFYYYAWKGKGAPRLKGEPGSPEFVASWEAAIAGLAGKEGTIGGLIDLWRESPKYKGTGRKAYSDTTRDNYDFWMNRKDGIKATFGDVPLIAAQKRDFRKEIIAWRDTFLPSTRQADFAIQAISILLSFGVDNDKLDANHALRIPKLYESDRSAIIWRTQDLAILHRYASAEVWQAAKLASLTGLRKVDALNVRWDQIGETKMHVPTRKSRKRTTAVVIRYPELDAFLETLTVRAETVLVNRGGKSWKSGFGASWTRTKARCLKHIEDETDRAYFAQLHFHDLRGNAATRLFAAGLSEAQIARFLGWKEAAVKALLDRYVSLDEAADLIAAKVQQTANIQAAEKSLEKNAEAAS
jgi:integrase